MFRPTLYRYKVTDITPNDLKEIGVDTLFLDVDNTLSTHHGMNYADGLIEWLEELKNNNVNLILTSNSNNKRVEPFAKGLNLPYISMSLKPLNRGFVKARKFFKVKKNNVCVVGDQVFTDVLGAKLYGVKVILLKPILLEDKFSFKVRRYLERIIFKIEKIGE